MTGRLYTLPTEVVSRIFEFDPTFHEEYRKCHWEIHNMGMTCKYRLPRELERLSAHPGVEVGAITVVGRRLELLYGGQQYVMTIPMAYPWEPPLVTVGGQPVRPFDFWSPSSTLLTVLLVCDVESRSGMEMC
jgi:hypothetical protein